MGGGGEGGGGEGGGGAAATGAAAAEDARRHLSARMTEEGNMWEELFERARPLPAWEQAPLFDAEHVGEQAVEGLAAMAPSDLFEQLFAAAVCAHHRAVEEAVDCVTEGDRSSPLVQTLVETAEYTSRLWVRGISQAKLEKICDTYRAFEDLLAASGGAAAAAQGPGGTMRPDNGWMNVN